MYRGGMWLSANITHGRFITVRESTQNASFSVSLGGERTQRAVQEPDTLLADSGGADTDRETDQITSEWIDR